MSGRRGFLAGLAAGAAALPVAATSVTMTVMPPDREGDLPGPDAELIQLGVRLDRATREEAAAWAALDAQDGQDDKALTAAGIALQNVTSEIVDQIEPCKATTMAGVMVKVRALAWCRWNDPITFEDFGFNWHRRGDPTTDMRLLASLANEMIAIAGAAP